jgi:hypothetical protein
MRGGGLTPMKLLLHVTIGLLDALALIAYFFRYAGFRGWLW